MRIWQVPRQCLAFACAAVAAVGCARDSSDSQVDRVVSVSKQINEFIYAVGAQQSLIARDLTSVYPPEIKRLPSVGYHRGLSAEGIISMKPRLFLTDGNVGPDAVLTQLRKVGIPILVMNPGSTEDSAQTLLTDIGRKFHREKAADSVLTQWKAAMAEIANDSLRWRGAPRPRVLLMHFGQVINNYLAIARGSPADRMIRYAGGINAIDSVGGMTRLSPELIAKSRPDVIVATDVGFDRMGSAHQFAQLPGVSLTPAAKNNRIYRIDESEIMYFGPRTPTTVRKLEEMIHPETSAVGSH
jgi:iron complex transport system substrate-binding protein